MAMLLRPLKGSPWLDVDEVIRRLRSEFVRVEVSPGGGKQFAESVAASYRKAGQADLANRVEAVKDKGACVGVFEGSPDRALILIVLPEFPIMVGFNSKEHLEAIQPLLTRSASALGYDLR